MDIDFELNTILDLIGHIGGIYYIVENIFKFLFQSISEHSFKIKAMEKIFYAQAKSKRMFEKPLGKVDKRR